MGKKALSVLLSAVMVAQMYASPVQTAYAQAAENAAQEQLTQALEESPNNSDDADAQSDEAEVQPVDNGQTGAADEQSEYNENSVTPPLSSDEDGVSDGEVADQGASGNDERASESNSAEPVASIFNNDAAAADNGEVNGAEEGIALADADGAYNPDADPVLIDENSGTLTVSISYDSAGTKPCNGEAITADTTLYGKFNVDFAANKLPTLAQPNVYYEIPGEITVADRDAATLYDSNNRAAGTWEIKNNKVVIKLSEEWLSQHISELSANFSFEFKIANQKQGDGEKTTIIFPGTGTTVTIPTKDEKVDGSKWALNNGAYDAEKGTYTWVIKVSPSASGAKNLVITDTIGDNLSFVEGSFSMCDKDGNPTSEKPTVTINGQVATISLGDRAQGDYYVTYTTKIKDSALKDLKDNQEVDNVKNSASWSWGSENPQKHDEIVVWPTKVKYSMVSKSASGTNDDITWTVKLNNGTLKADMSGYTFTDTLGDGHAFKSGTQYVVTDESGKTIASGDVDPNSKTLTFTLPSGIGKQSLTVTYHTAMTDTSSPDPVKNTVDVTPGDDKYPSGKGDGSYTPSDERIYVSKTFEKKSDDGATAQWSSIVYFSNMASVTDVSTVKWEDTISKSPYSDGFNPFVFSDVVLKTSKGNVALSEGVDYKISQNASTCTITFLKTDTVAGLVGKEDVVITYTTAPQKTGAVPSTGDRFTNTSTVYVNNVKKGSAEASYSIDGVPPVYKSNGTTSWDVNYDWGDGTTGAWVTSWKVVANTNGEWDKGVTDLGNAGITIKDTLPSGMTYVKDSAKYYLYGGLNGYNNSGYYTQSPTVTEESGVVSFAIPTSGVATDGHWVGRVEMTYQTAVKASDVPAGQSVVYTNTASAESGDTKFPAGSGSTTIENKVLDKTMAKSSADSSRVKYTIKVNEKALDLDSKSDILTLTDTMSSTLAYTNGSLKVVDASGNDITSSCPVTVENAVVDGQEKTVLTLTVPDAKALTVTYECSPIGAIGQTVTVSNSCSLNGITAKDTETSNKVIVQEADAGVVAVSYGLTVTKVAKEDTNKRLEGAEFTLYTVDKTTGELTESQVATTNEKGVVTFGTAANPLKVGTIYFVKETKAPAGYELSYDGTYMVFYPATATEQAKADFQAAYDAAVKLGHTPIVGTISDETHKYPGVSITAYDKKSTAATATPKVHKTVTGKASSEEYSFGLFAAKQVGEDWVKDGDAVETVTAKDNETASFSALSFKEEGTYHYVISETSELGSGWSNNGDVVVTIVVDKNANDELEATVYYSKSTTGVDAGVITNTYKATGSATLSAHKTVTGGTDATADKEFKFELYEGEGTTGTKLGTVTAKDGQTVDFSAVNYKLADAGKEFKYTIHETGQSGSGWTLAGDVTATVKVVDNGNGALGTTVTYSTATTDGSAALFTNKYATSGKATIDVYKTVNGSATAKPDEVFTFDLYEGEGTTGTKLDTVTLKTGETKSFQELTITEAGTKTYTVHEVGHNGNGWTAADDVNVTVTATDNGDGSLTTKVEYSNGTNAAAFNDTYEEATGSFQLNLEKTVNGAAPKDGETFEFSATSTDGGPALQNVTTDASGKASFAAVDLGDADAGKTYTYTISEVSNLDTTHWTKANDVTATVTVGTRGSDGKLPVTVKYSTGDTATYAAFDNTYATTGSADIKVSKTVVGGTEAVKDEVFTFELVNADNEVVSTVKAKAGETVTFEGVTYTTADAGKTYEYTVRETGHNDKGWTAQAETTATVKVTENADRSISATVTYGRGDGAATFTNTYATKGNATIDVYKTVNGGTEAKKGEKFTFQLLDSQKKVVDAVETEAGNKASFKNLEITGEGTWTYTVHEVGHDSDAWFAASDVTATVTAKDNGDGTLDVTVEYSNGTNAAAFDNTYAPTSASLEVQKTVNGGSINSDEKFEFQLYKANESGEKEGDALQTVTVDGSKSTDGKASFSAIDFDKVGTSYYVITESSTLDGDHWTKAGDVEVTVTVTRDATNKKLVASVDYSNGDDAAKFDNTYTDTAYANLFVNKKVVGGTDATKDESFEFSLYEADGYTVDAQGNVTAGIQIGNTVSVKADGTASFDALEYSLDDAGKTFNYVIHEVGHRTDGWTAAADVNVTVEVVQAADRSISTKVTYSNANEKGTAALFTNTYASSGEATISVYKTVNGGTEAKKGEKFTFDLYKADEDGNAEGNKLGTVETEAGKVASFENVKYTEAGTYYYVVKETGHDGKGWTAASDVKATVTVTDNGKGGLTAEVAYNNTAQGAAGFDDTYEATGSATVSVKKTVNQGTLTPDQEFTFGLFETDENGDKTGDALDTVSVKAGEAAKSFDALEYTFDEVGTHTYVISETSTLSDAWTKAADQKVTVTVTDNNDGTLSAAVAYDNDQKDAATFDNTYSSSVSAKLGVTKTVNGKDDIRDNEKFTFELQDSKGNKLAETTVDSKHHTASFDAQTYDKAGTYEYNVHETSQLGEGWTNASDQKVYVKVEADKNGNLSVTSVTYGDKKETITAGTTGEYDLVVNNTYATTTKATIDVNKTVVGGTEAVEGETFDFTLKKDDQTVDSVTGVEDGGTKSFKELSFDKAGTYEYVVTEDGHNDKGWTASGDVKVTVTVTENADRTLTATVKYGESDADTAAKFTNTYDAKGDATIKVEKTVNGGSMAAEGEEFTFDLYNAKQDKDGNWVKYGSVIQTDLKVKADGTASFDALSFSTLGGEGVTKVSNGDVLHFVIHETGHNNNGWTAADDVVATVTITEDGTKGTLSAIVAYSNGTNAAAFDDTYTEGTSAQLKATKTLTGRDAEADEFEFRVYALDGQGNKVGDPVATAKNVAAKDGAVSDVTFPAISYDTIGTYSYQIEELVGTNGKVGYDKTTYKATVKVTKDAATGKLSADVKYFNADGTERTEAPAFKNTFSYDGVTADVEATKSLAGANIADYNGKFEFELRSDDGATLYATATNDAKGFVNFTPNFTKAGTYIYKILEKTGIDTGMFYDGNYYFVEIAVSGDTSKLTVDSVTYLASDGETVVDQKDVVFSNTKSTATAEVKVDKTVNGVKNGGVTEKFTFELIDNDDNDKSLGTVTVDGTSTATFEGLTYDTTGDHHYTVHETSDLGDGWFNAGDVKVTVHVTRDEDNKKLVATVDYGDKTVDAAKFDNIHNTESAELKLYKTINGGDIAEGEKFTFTLLDEDGNRIGEEKVADKTNPVATFDKIDYETAGTYTYTIHETTELTDGWTNDADVTVTVTVVRDEESKTLKVESIDYGERAYEHNGQTMAHFDDKYSTTVDSGLEVNKKVNGGTDAVAGETFDFVLKDKDGNQVSEAHAKAGETVPFEGVTYTTDDAGKTFEYTITEVGHNENGWTADSDVTVTVKVTQNADRSLKVERTYSRGTNVAEFTNTYATAGEVTLSLYKTINGQSSDIDFGDEEFTFTLIDPSGKTLELVSTTVGQVASFSPLPITGEGTWAYTIHELGHRTNGWEADADVVAVVTAKDKGDGTLDISVKYSRVDGVHDAAWFDNKYTGVRDENDKKSESGKSGKAMPATGDVALNYAPFAIAGGTALVAFGLRRRKHDEE
ncbi:MAG: FctA domain-containing protein [Coriobacteriia bacterium]|nr:FctA domain-containing protein [Coriobacteriia bacterium]